MKYLLDTNILSELKKTNPNKNVIQFVNNLSSEMFFISCISIGEIKYGIDSCKNLRKATDLNLWFEKYLLINLKDRILDIDVDVMCAWAELTSVVKNLPIMDSLIAATCLKSDLCLVTRNLKDFVKIKNLKIFDPFAA